MITFLTVLHIVSCVFLVILVLVQSGKGAEISASFGGSSQTVFGSSGGANFFTRATAVMAGIFLLTALALVAWGGKSKKSVFDGATIPTQPLKETPPAPAAPDAAAPAAPAAAPAKSAP
jgi:preprotein translocase subunit SecG